MRARTAGFIVAPILLLALSLAAFILTDPLRLLGIDPPPAERLTVERTVMDDSGFRLKVRAGGDRPMEIVQVLVDEAYWQYEQEPGGAIAAGESVWIRIPFNWVRHAEYEITFLSASGLTFSHHIPVAQTTPQASAGQVAGYGLLGLYVGVVPVALGLLFYPALKQAGPRGLQAALALTLGLLAFLLVDTLEEGLALAEESAPIFQGGMMVWMAALLAFLALVAIGRRHRKPPEGLALGTYIALGIGLHNLGEGLAIGGALAAGAGALGTFLVVGFTLHNLTEGIGIAAPLVREKVRKGAWAGLIALAGLPAVLGTWIGAYAFAPHWSAVFLGIGSGAILQVLVEVAAAIRRQAASQALSPLTLGNLGGFAAGVGLMYATALLVQL